MLDKCIISTLRVGANGYPVYYDPITKKQMGHHRQVMGAKKGDPYVLHSCDNKRCINLEHLRFGTHSENMQEAIERGRFDSYWKKERTHCPNGHRYTKETTSIKTGSNGKPHKRCLICHRDNQRKYNLANRLSKEVAKSD